MTLEEAKKQIQAQANAQWEEFKKTGSSLHQGFALGGEDALEILDEVDAEPVGNPDKLTLTELARQPLWILKYRYITVSDFNHKGHLVMEFWEDKPTFSKVACIWDHASFIYTVDVSNLGFTLDLSEYKDADGNIDYSKCIVEVE